MNAYGITFKDNGKTILIDAEFYEISEGFVRFYKAERVDNPPEEFAAYSADNVVHCVLQKEFTRDQILADMERARTNEKV